MLKYEWISGDTGGSPVYETLERAEAPMSLEELQEATGVDKEEVAAHLFQGVKAGLVRTIVEPVRPTLVKPVQVPTAVPTPKRAGGIASEAEMMAALAGGKPAAKPKEEAASMTDYLLGGRRSNEQDEEDVGDLLGRNVGL